MKLFAALALVFVPISASTSATPQPPLGKSPAGLAQQVVTIDSRGHRHQFVAEVAASADEQAQGLMFRQELAPDRAMIFPYDPPIPVSFWMENTLIPLDLVFIDSNGLVGRVAADAQPLSTELIHSGGPVSAVLEIAGGRAAELGIEPGDRVEWAH